MKKIKRKTGDKRAKAPDFVIGFAVSAPIPPGFLAAWFNDIYGGPLHIRFPESQGHSLFEASHTSWRALVHTALPQETAQEWRKRLGWDHQAVAEIRPLPSGSAESRDVVLHRARLARGLTLLSEGTSFDVSTATFWNPSDWRDRLLEDFQVRDHIGVNAVDQFQRERMWYHTRGLGKFGLEEFEIFTPRGLPEGPMKDLLMEAVEVCTDQRKSPKVGEAIDLMRSGQTLRVVRHRTDQSYGAPLHLREVLRV